MNLLVIVVTMASLCAASPTSTVPVGARYDIQMLQSIMNGQSQEDINPNSETDFISKAIDEITPFVVSKLSNPNTMEEDKKSLKVARLVIEALHDHLNKAVPNDNLALTFLYVIKSFLSSLEKNLNNNNDGRITIGA